LPGRSTNGEHTGALRGGFDQDQCFSTSVRDRAVHRRGTRREPAAPAGVASGVSGGSGETVAASRAIHRDGRHRDPVADRVGELKFIRGRPKWFE
jgi:hypothetical protein